MTRQPGVPPTTKPPGVAMDFDQERQARVARLRTFRIGGEQFTVRASVRPEALLDWESVGGDTSAEETLRVIDSTILALVENENGQAGAHERWQALRTREDDAVSLEDLLDVMAWLMEQQTGRPTVQPSDSSTKPEQAGTNSTDASSSAASPVEPEPSTLDSS